MLNSALHRVGTRPVLQPSSDGVCDVTEPSTSDVIEPSTSDVTEPSTSDVIEPSTSNVIEPSTSDVIEPSISDITELSTSDLTELSSDELDDTVGPSVKHPTTRFAASFYVSRRNKGRVLYLLALPQPGSEEVVLVVRPNVGLTAALELSDLRRMYRKLSPKEAEEGWYGYTLVHSIR